ncbi:MAG TPA: TIR domain-containing protein [Pyrinomonadaceae bacterium]|nr:TIR domain-containing protein [Pyrinomonadaceae bacterium]
MSGKETILVLDNEKKWLKTINNLLKDNYNLILTTSVAQARKHVKDNSIALAILDQKLSKKRTGITGIQVLGTLRKDSPSLRAIILTAFPDDDDISESFHAGALDYIKKGSNDLKAKLINSIERSIEQGKEKKNKIQQGEEKKNVRIFLAYQNEDRKRVEDLFHKLTAKGFIPWMDVYSAAKGKWEPQGQKAIGESDFFLACFSPGSLRKKQSVFRKELKLALKIQEELFIGEVFIIPVKLTDCEIPEEFWQFQYVNYFEKGGFAKLVKMLI